MQIFKNAKCSKILWKTIIGTLIQQFCDTPKSSIHLFPAKVEMRKLEYKTEYDETPIDWRSF